MRLVAARHTRCTSASYGRKSAFFSSCLKKNIENITKLNGYVMRLTLSYPARLAVAQVIRKVLIMKV